MVSDTKTWVHAKFSDTKLTQFFTLILTYEAHQIE